MYSMTSNREAIRTLFREVKRYVGKPGVFPDPSGANCTQRRRSRGDGVDALGDAGPLRTDVPKSGS
jgi:hypothetical protein